MWGEVRVWTVAVAVAMCSSDEGYGEGVCVGDGCWSVCSDGERHRKWLCMCGDVYSGGDEYGKRVCACVEMCAIGVGDMCKR